MKKSLNSDDNGLSFKEIVCVSLVIAALLFVIFMGARAGIQDSKREQQRILEIEFLKNELELQKKSHSLTGQTQPPDTGHEK